MTMFTFMSFQSPCWKIIGCIFAFRLQLSPCKICINGWRLTSTLWSCVIESRRLWSSSRILKTWPCFSSTFRHCARSPSSDCWNRWPKSIRASALIVSFIWLRLLMLSPWSASLSIASDTMTCRWISSHLVRIEQNLAHNRRDIKIAFSAACLKLRLLPNALKRNYMWAIRAF